MFRCRYFLKQRKVKVDCPNIEAKELAKVCGEPNVINEIVLKEGYVYIDGEMFGKVLSSEFGILKVFVNNGNKYMSGKIQEFNFSNKDTRKMIFMNNQT